MDVSPADEETQSSPFIEEPQAESYTPLSDAFSPQTMDTLDEATESLLAADGGELDEKLVIKPRTIAGQISLILEDMVRTSSLREKGIKLI